MSMIRSSRITVYSVNRTSTKRLLLSLGVVMFFLLATSLAWGGLEDYIKKGEELRVEIKIKEYVFGAMWDYDEITGCRGYHASVCEILKPERYRDNSLYIYHDMTLPEDSLWKEVGAVFTIDLDEMDFSPNVQVFSHPFMNITRETEKK